MIDKLSAKAPPAAPRTSTLDVNLLGRDYKVACKQGEEAELREAVSFLDQRMREIRESSKTTSVERIAVMTALNLAHELQRMSSSTPAPTEVSGVPPPAVIDAPAARRRIANMRAAIDQVLANQEKLL